MTDGVSDRRDTQHSGNQLEQRCPGGRREKEDGGCESDQRETLPLLANAKTFEVLIKIYEEINI